MDFDIGNLVSSFVGAVAAVATAVAGSVSAIGDAVSSVAEAVMGAAAAVANGNIDEDEINEAIEEANKVLVGAFIAGFGSGLSEVENETDNSENNDKYRIKKGESGDGFWGKVADAWVSSPVYDALASMAEWEDENPEAMDALSFMTIFMHPGSTGGANGVEYESEVIENRSTYIEGGSEAESIPNRPSWRQSELDVESDYPNYNPQKSFIDGEEVPYGTKGSSRPDFYQEGSSIEVKNYKITTPEGQNRLINNVSNQVNKRITDLPDGTSQTIIIDFRGQEVTNDILRNIRDKIIEKSNTNVTIQFKR